MEKVVGIGGVFFRASDPKALARWYLEHLGVTPVPETEDGDGWHQEAGPTVFAPFERDTEYFGKPTQAWMINFRVRDLDAIVRQLRGAGITVDVDATPCPFGRFARLSDPDGNPIELWEPKTP